MQTLTTDRGGVQMPDDTQAVGYRETRPFHHEQVFYSAKHDFKGTEAEFIAAGFAYRYRQSGSTRYVESERD